jgi:hypothetical protein
VADSGGVEEELEKMERGSSNLKMDRTAPLGTCDASTEDDDEEELTAAVTSVDEEEEAECSADDRLSLLLERVRRVNGAAGCAAEPEAAELCDAAVLLLPCTGGAERTVDAPSATLPPTLVAKGVGRDDVVGGAVPWMLDSKKASEAAVSWLEGPAAASTAA